MLRKDLKEAKSKLAEENAALKSQTEILAKERTELLQKTTELKDQIETQRARLVQMEIDAKTKPPSANESDEIGLVMVENENLKRKIKMLELEAGKQGQAEKLAKKVKEKEDEIKDIIEQQKLSVAQLVL